MLYKTHATKLYIFHESTKSFMKLFFTLCTMLLALSVLAGSRGGFACNTLRQKAALQRFDDTEEEEYADDTVPEIISFGIPDARTVLIRFSVSMSDIDGEVGKCVSVSGKEMATVSLQGAAHNVLQLRFDSPLTADKETEINISGLYSRSGIMFADTALMVALPRAAERSDVIFNEIMPYVTKPNSKFVELYNNSGFYLDLHDMTLCNPANDKGNTHSKTLSADSKVLAPHCYAVIAPDLDQINALEGKSLSALYIASSLPSFAANSGTVMLKSADGITIDSLRYSDRWHNPLLRDLHDVSLERISPIRPTNDSTNWQSATADAGYNTAGRLNSQYRKDDRHHDNGKAFFTDQKHFSPDGDGYLDFFTINYSMPAPGYLLCIDIYTRSGASVGRIIDNELIGLEGKIEWDGTTVSGSFIPTGLYVIYIQAVNTREGDIITQKFVVLKE